MITNFNYLSTNVEGWSKLFKDAKPFEHVIIEDAFSDFKLGLILNEFGRNLKWDERHDDEIQVKIRSDWKDDSDIPPLTFELINELNSGNFLRFLSKLTGIEGIICDPYLTGGGYNEIKRGGHLAVHADGNWHDLMGVHRRLNVIIFLNYDWKDNWHGHFELWESDLSECVKKIRPDFNKMIIFKTDDFSMHGHPIPLACPSDRSRKSIILYYYTATRLESEVNVVGEKHRAQFVKTYKEIE